MIFVATVLLVSMTAPEITNSALHYTFIAIGLLVWVIGFVFESVGDSQLKRFIKNPENKGKIMDKGLWRYTRHPNYFGESVMWWGLAIMAISVQYGYIGFLSPIIITYLLLFISGVPLLEKAFKDNMEFQKYAARTSIFIPWFPKRDKSRKDN
jgi:steroid 5-alpha reductase family enzyme